MKKYERIHRDLESAINTGRLSPGDKLPSDSELCGKYSVSRITVVKAMDALVRIGLVTRKPKVGTYVASKSKKNNPYYLLVPSFANSFNVKSSHAFMEYCRERNTVGAVVHTMYDLTYISKIVDQLNLTGASGIAIYPSDNQNDDELLLRCLNRARCDVIVGYRELPGFEGVQIINDEDASTRLAVNHLIELGHRRIAFVGEPESECHIHNRMRYRAFRKTCAAAGLNEGQCPHITEVGIPSLHTLKDIFTSSDAPTAIVAASEYHAFSIFDVITSFSIKMPEDVALVALDGSEKSLSAEIPFTSVEFPALGIGFALAEQLHLIDDDQALPRGVYKKTPKLIVRNSCGVNYSYRHTYIIDES